MDISQVAAFLRPVCKDVFNGKGILCLSTNYLKKFNDAFETNINEDFNKSFHMVQTSNAKANLMRDLQFLLDLVQRTIHLKVIPDVNDDPGEVDITRFKHIKILEIHKIDIKLIIGIQKLTSQLQDITCSHSVACLSDVLDKCGSDGSQRYSWNDLKRANFSHNGIVELDDSLESTHLLHTLNLSHNQLSTVNFVNLLPNLKCLNLSYNKIITVPHFKGHICKRLQVLVLKNNFIEGLQGLTSLSNIVQLDLGHNCLLDHKVLLAISHFPSLQWLNLQGNPISFHPHHRNVTCNYLNKNSSTLKFVLDDILLNKREKSLTGSLYPLFQTTIPAGSSHNSLDDSVNGSIQEKTRRIRHVIIEDYSTTKEDKTPALTPPTSSQHLEIKRQVEQLREEYGESWLYRHSGMLVQDVLGLQKTGVLSSTPYESAMGSFSLPSHIQEELISSNINFETVKDESSAELKEDKFTTANDESGIFNNSMVDDLSDVSDGDDICEGGEECIFLATNTADNDQVFVVLTKTHISERDVTTSKERARWHFNTVRRFEMVEDNQNAIKIDFDTLRRDRKQRIYDLDPEESESFQRFLQMKIKNTQKPAQKKVTYQCMKCSELFPEQNKNALLDQPSVTCPRCKSNLVIESM